MEKPFTNHVVHLCPNNTVYVLTFAAKVFPFSVSLIAAFFFFFRSFQFVKQAEISVLSLSFSLCKSEMSAHTHYSLFFFPFDPAEKCTTYTSSLLLLRCQVKWPNRNARWNAQADTLKPHSHTKRHAHRQLDNI